MPKYISNDLCRLIRNRAYSSGNLALLNQEEAELENIRSVFADSTINRLVLIGDKFVQSSAELIGKQLAPFDGYLSCLVRNLDFDESRELLHVTKMEQLTGNLHHTNGISSRVVRYDERLFVRQP